MPSSEGSNRDAARLAHLARELLWQGGTLESTASGERITGSELKSALGKAIGAQGLAGGTATEIVAGTIIATAERAMNKVQHGVSRASLTDAEYSSLEAIVLVIGRPAMRYHDGRVAMPSDDIGANGRWRTVVATTRSKINTASASVARIAPTNALPAATIGTGWRCGSALLITNRHVARKMASNPNDAPQAWRLQTTTSWMADFNVTDSPTSRTTAKVSAIAYCAPDEDLDVAVLKLDTSSALPASLTLNWNTDAIGRDVVAAGGGAATFSGEEIYIVGHPYRNLPSEASATVFGRADGTKRWSPGYVRSVDPARPLLDHDCSTLGGNSGSCVLTTASHEVVGLHYGGVQVDESTGRGSANRALALCRLGAHQLATVMRTGTI